MEWWVWIGIAIYVIGATFVMTAHYDHDPDDRDTGGIIFASMLWPVMILMALYDWCRR